MTPNIRHRLCRCSGIPISGDALGRSCHRNILALLQAWAFISTSSSHSLEVIYISRLMGVSNTDNTNDIGRQIPDEAASRVVAEENFPRKRPVVRRAPEPLSRHTLPRLLEWSDGRRCVCSQAIKQTKWFLKKQKKSTRRPTCMCKLKP